MIVRTASEFKRLVREKDMDSVSATDTITCATMGMVDTVSADFSIRMPKNIPSGYVDSVRLNGLSIVPDMVRDGTLDCMIHGETEREDGYGTGHLYRDIASGKEIDVSLVMDDKEYCASVTIDDMFKATMSVLYDYGPSMRAFINDSPSRRMAFHSCPNGLPGNLEGCSVIGCGEIEPSFNHHGMASLKIGDTVLLNGSPGKVTRVGIIGDDTTGFIQVVADMHSMDPRYMGGFSTPYGPACIVSLATMIHIDYGNIPRECVVSDMGVPLPIVNRDDITPKHWSSYGDVWPRSSDIGEDRARCLNCVECSADALCPMGAGPSKGPDPDLCLSCGSCIHNCRGNVFSGDLGYIVVGGSIVPISIRLSSRKKAEELCEHLRDAIIGDRI